MLTKDKIIKALIAFGAMLFIAAFLADLAAKAI
jgi:hypothetical protein